MEEAGDSFRDSGEQTRWDEDSDSRCAVRIRERDEDFRSGAGVVAPVNDYTNWSPIREPIVGSAMTVACGEECASSVREGGDTGVLAMGKEEEEEWCDDDRGARRGVSTGLHATAWSPIREAGAGGTTVTLAAEGSVRFSSARESEAEGVRVAAAEERSSDEDVEVGSHLMASEERWGLIRESGDGDGTVGSEQRGISSSDCLASATAEGRSRDGGIFGGGVITMSPAEERSLLQESYGGIPTMVPAGGWSCPSPRDTDAGSLTERPAEEWSPIREPVQGGQSPLLADHKDACADAFHNFFAGEEESCGELGLRARDPKISSLFVDEGERIPIASSDEVVAEEPPSKRKKISHSRKDAVVQVTFTNLCSESKRALQFVLQNWSQSYLEREPLDHNAVDGDLMSGTEIYSSAFALRPKSNSTSVVAWMDKPARIQERTGTPSEKVRDQEEDVPLYDRACVSVLSSSDSYDCNDRNPFDEMQEVSRCFNCGSYSHSLKTCSRPHDTANIRNAINARNAKNSPLGRKGNISSSRYYESSPSGKFDDLKPGFLGFDTRQALGIGELDPPPWLNRMREIGYPPGYLQGVETDSSGVEIIGESFESGFRDEQTWDGIPAERDVPPDHARLKIMTVNYPGINAPIPENADKTLWIAASPKSSRTGEKRSFAQMSQVHDRKSAQEAALAWMEGKDTLSSDPATYWYERHLQHVGAVDGFARTVQAHRMFANSFDGTSRAWASERATARRPNLFPSPGIRPSQGALPQFGFLEGFTGRNYEHHHWQRSYPQSSYAPDRPNRDAWKKAEAALRTMRSSGDVSVFPPGTDV